MMTPKEFFRAYLSPKGEAYRFKWIEKNLKKLKPGTSIIDVGAGEMPFKKWCAHLKYTSQDFGEYTGENVESGLQTGKFDAKKVDILSDIIDIPVKNCSFDHVLCVEVFEHIPDTHLALREISRIQKKGGTLLITAPFVSLTHFYPYHYHSGFSPEFYKVNLKKWGYKVQEVYTYGNYFNGIAQELLRLPFVVWGYSKFWFLVSLPLFALHLPFYFFIRWVGYLFPQSASLLCFGVCVRAVKA